MYRTNPGIHRRTAGDLPWLSAAVKATEPAVPWRAIAGFRNVLAHNYLGIDPAVVWSVVEKDLPSLDAVIGRMLRTIDASKDRS